MTLWAYRSRAWARKAWEAWYRLTIRCRLEPVKKVARMIKRHLDGILAAVVDKVTDARDESISAGTQKLKYSARGFRNPQATPQRGLLSPRRPRSIPCWRHPVTRSFHTDS